MAPNNKAMLSILKRSDADALICLTPAPAPNELAQRLSQGHQFHVTAVVTFPDAHWARDLAAHLAEERVGGADSSWYAVSPSDAILKILELWGANPDEEPREAPAKRARRPCQTAKKGTSGITTDSSAPSLEPPQTPQPKQKAWRLAPSVRSIISRPVAQRSHPKQLIFGRSCRSCTARPSRRPSWPNAHRTVNLTLVASGGALFASVASPCS